MGELLRNAWLGWLNASKAGKLGGALLLVLLLTWAFQLGRDRQKDLLRYATVMTIACIFPVTAGILMLWQTRFYDYEWIWTAVPVTGMIACGCVLLLDFIWNGEWKKIQKGIVTAMALGLLLLCGRLNNPEWTVRDLAQERRSVAAVLQELRKAGDGELCLWAPKEVIAQARSIDPQITLLYGKNMWEEHLNAYSYDVYDQDRRDLYVWMVMIGRYGTLDVPVATDVDVVGERLQPGSQLDGLACMRKALGLGVNRTLLPGNMSGEALDTLRAELGAEVTKVGEYWLVVIPERS